MNKTTEFFLYKHLYPIVHLNTKHQFIKKRGCDFQTKKFLCYTNYEL